MYKVQLERYEVMLAAGVGVRRYVSSLFANHRDTLGKPTWDSNIEGAGGEIALAKALNTYWNGSVNTFRVGGDVGELEVRTRSKDEYDLIIRDKDKDNSIYILLTGTMPNYTVVGWIYGREGKRDEWKKEYGGGPMAYFVPKDVLHPMSELMAVVADKAV